MAVEGSGPREIASHLKDSTVLSSIAHRLHQRISEEIAAHEEVEALARRWKAKAAAFRASGSKGAALEAEERADELDTLANTLADSVPMLEAIDSAERLAREHQRRER
jgi:hypothetical protein